MTRLSVPFFLLLLALGLSAQTTNIHGQALNPSIGMAPATVSAPLQVMVSTLFGGDPVVGATVSFSATPGLILSSSQAVTDSSGVASVQVLVLAGTSGGTVDAVLPNGSVVLFTVTVDASTALNVITPMSPTMLVWQGSSTIVTGTPITANIALIPDANGRQAPAAGVTLTVAVAFGDVQLLDAQGNPAASLTLTSSADGGVSFDAAFPSDAAPPVTSVLTLSAGGTATSVVVHAYAPSSPPVFTVVAPSGNQALPLSEGGNPGALIELQLADASGAPLTGVAAVPVTASGGQAISCAQTAMTTGAGGFLTCHPAAEGAVGPGTVAFVAGSLIVSPAIRYVILAGAPAVIRILSGNRQHATSGESLNKPLTAMLLDAAGNALGGSPVEWQTDGAVIESAPGATALDGTVAVTARALDRPGPAFVTLRTSQTSATFTIFNDSTGQLSKIAGDGQMANPGQSFDQPLLVKLSAPGGTPIPNATIMFGVTGGAAVLGSPSAVTNAAGQAQVAVTAGVAPGLVRISATIGQNTTEFQLFNMPAAVNNLVIADWNGNPAPLTPGALMNVSFTLTGPSNLAAAVNSAAPYPTVSQNLRLSVDGVYAPLVSIQPAGATITALIQVPWEAAAQPLSSLTVWYAGTASRFSSLPLQLAAPAIRKAADGLHAALAEGANGAPQGIVYGGATVEMQATGLGPFAPAASTNSTGIAGQTPQLPLLLFVDGSPVTTLQAAADPNSPGVADITFQLPPWLPPGAHELWLSIFAGDYLIQSPVVELDSN